jgi:hypothetical protein
MWQAAETAKPMLAHNSVAEVLCSSIPRHAALLDQQTKPQHSMSKALLLLLHQAEHNPRR